MNPLDIALALLVLVAAVRGFRQGALTQVLAFGGAALGLVAGAAWSPPLAGLVITEPGATLALSALGLLLLFVLLGQGLGFGIGVWLRGRVARAGRGALALDGLAGVPVAVGFFVVTLWLLTAVLAQGPFPSVVRLVRGSVVVGVIDRTLPPPPDLFGRVATYLDRQGFPPVFAGIGETLAPPVDVPADTAVAAAQAAGQAGTVQVQALGCGGVSAGSGFVTQPGFVVTNAHVVAGGEVLSVRDRGGIHPAVPVLVDPVMDVAVLASPGAVATPLPWTVTPVDRGVAGATLGFPGGQTALNVRPAAVRARSEALGRDIYGRGLSSREILTLSAAVASGDSGGPFVTAQGQVGGVVFAASVAEPGTGYALTAEQVRPTVEQAIARNTPAATGACRF